MTLTGASGAISGMLNVTPDLMQPLLDGIEEPRVNAMVDAVLAYPVTAAVKALVGLRRNDPCRLEPHARALASLSEAEVRKLRGAIDEIAASARLTPLLGRAPLLVARPLMLWTARIPRATMAEGERRRRAVRKTMTRHWSGSAPASTLASSEEMTMAAPLTIRLHPRRQRRRGAHGHPARHHKVEGEVAAATRVPPGHKILTRAVKQGEPLRKYNQIIGFATEDMTPGTHIHTHNCVMGDFERDYAFCADARPTDYITPAATFMGYRRADGRAATRNYIGIVTTVNCSAATSRMIAARLEPLLAQYPNIDGVVPLTHGGGCGMAASGLEMDVLRRTLAGYTRHPNMARGGGAGPGLRDQPDRRPDERRGTEGRAEADPDGHPG